MQLLWSSAPGICFPVLGKNTSKADLVEAMFALDRATTTAMDIERVWACHTTKEYEDGMWTEHGVQDDLCAK